MALKAVIFDAYGTLFDVYAIGTTAEALFPGRGAQIADLWRDKQLEYTRLRTMCHRYISFWDVTADALRYTGKKLDLDLSDAQFAALMDQYARLTAFADNRDTLNALKTLGLPLALLSNGNLAMIKAALAAADLTMAFDHILSADQVKAFKTAPQTYQLGPDAFGCSAEEILFVSSNGWDICGATWFGYTTYWVNRAANPPEELGVSPHGEGRSLLALPAFVRAHLPSFPSSTET